VRLMNCCGMMGSGEADFRNRRPLIALGKLLCFLTLHRERTRSDSKSADHMVWQVDRINLERRTSSKCYGLLDFIRWG
jgi:hypothetical protein